MKHLIQKVASSGNLACEAFDKGFLELRNTLKRTMSESIPGQYITCRWLLHGGDCRAEGQETAMENSWNDDTSVVQEKVVFAGEVIP